MSWVAPQQYSSWTTTMHGAHGAPSGWQGSWPPTAPAYSGPPPAPAGVNPQAWAAGQWQLNPMFRQAMAGAQAAVPSWAPHPSWGPQAANAAGAAANPYKRTANPGDADYWNTKLGNNGLGLENMHIRDDAPKKTRDNGVMHTPWVWAPKELCESPERHDSSELRNGQDRPDQQDQRQRSQAAPPQARPHDRQTSSQESHRHSRQPTESHNGYNGQASARETRSEDRSSDYRRESTASRLTTDRTREHSSGSERNFVPPRPERGPEHGAERSGMHERNGMSERVMPGPPNSAAPPAAISSYSAYSQQQQQQQQQQEPQHQRQDSRKVSPRDSQYQAREIDHSPNRPPVSSASSSASAAAAARLTGSSGHGHMSEAFSSKQELRPTFSPSIIRTANHYSSTSSSTPTRRMSSDDAYSSSNTTPSRRISASDAYTSSTSTPTRRASHDDVGRTPARSPVSPHSHGPIYAPPSNAPSRSNSLSKRQSAAPASSTSATTTSASSSAPPLTILANFSEEPAGLLSPLVGPNLSSTGGTSPGSREVTRSQTYPSFPGSNFEAIPEDRAISQPRTPRSSDNDRTRDPHATPYANPRSPPRSTRVSPDAVPRQISRSQTYPTMDPSTSSRPSPTSSRSPHASRSRGPSPTRTARLNNNPLPQPPMPSSYSTSTASMPSLTASAPQPPSNRKIRKGFWNRRGDHLIMERHGQFIVYAPRNMANPSELAHYPSPTEGFLDHRGQKVKYDPSVPELPESLPLHGEPPSRPYEHFIQYV